jgi:hypothetical protein
VGGGVKPDSEVSWILSFILGDSDGEEIAHRIDRTIAKLPGLQWFDRLSRSRDYRFFSTAFRHRNQKHKRQPIRLPAKNAGFAAKLWYNSKNRSG